MIAKTLACCVSLIALLTVAAPARAVAQTTRDDCEARIAKLDASQAEGGERLFEKRAVLDACFNQYKRDKTIAGLVLECAKYEEQPVVKQQAVAECQLAAFKYANQLRELKARFRK
jgi:hypothetical protein